MLTSNTHQEGPEIPLETVLAAHKQSVGGIVQPVGKMLCVKCGAGVSSKIYLPTGVQLSTSALKQK